MAIDFLGNKINIGDKVVFIQKEYRNFYTGTVKKITDKMLIIEHKKDNLCRSETKQYHNQVIVINDLKQEGNL